MKNLLACLAILAAFNVTAQVDGFQLPYNPDAQPDGFIGAADVVELLTYYGQSFTPDGIYVNDDSTHMVLDVGDHNFYNCIEQCSLLPGSWRVLTDADVGVVYEDFPMSRHVWKFHVDFNQNFNSTATSPSQTTIIALSSNGGSLTQSSNNRNNESGCFCATQERPKVEYSYCYAVAEGSDPTPFQTCANQKVSEGWYPSSGISSFYDPLNGLKKASQAFWRWAD